MPILTAPWVDTRQACLSKAWYALWIASPVASGFSEDRRGLPSRFQLLKRASKAPYWLYTNITFPGDLNARDAPDDDVTKTVLPSKGSTARPGFYIPPTSFLSCCLPLTDRISDYDHAWLRPATLQQPFIATTTRLAPVHAALHDPGTGSPRWPLRYALGARARGPERVFAGARPPFSYTLH
ncbi:hypothetical protein B0H16DRAFT_183928 [Mycena metata]|uniref:Uncharacterized protein n=1 Tax=Mycena metata TaxID=1033252 RepID=A0AAD7I0K1_9AGAR|nr:hypothetical protein B0H16DRAFT_183928 [Mycena metata]